MPPTNGAGAGTFTLLSPNFGGSGVGRADLIGIPAIFQACRIIADTIASLPCSVYADSDEGWNIDRKHPAHFLVAHQADDDTTAFDFRRAWVFNALLGNGFARIVRYPNSMRVRAMRVVVGTVTPQYAPSGELFYIVSDTRFGGGGTQEVVPARDILHIRNQTLDGLRGLELSHFFQTILSGQRSAMQFEASYYANSAAGGGWLEVPGDASAKLAAIQARFADRNAGTGKAGGTIILDGGMKLHPLNVNAKDAALIETRSFHVSDVARLLNVSPIFLHDLQRATFNNVAELTQHLATHTLQPWIKQLEQVFDMRLRTDQEKQKNSISFRVNMSALMRGRHLDRMQGYQMLISSGVMSPNEVREMEGFNQREGGDIYLTPMNMTTDPIAAKEQVATGEGESDESKPAASNG
ncbi:MAG: phage portal protein [Shewanella sp.]